MNEEYIEELENTIRIQIDEIDRLEDEIILLIYEKDQLINEIKQW